MPVLGPDPIIGDDGFDAGGAPGTYICDGVAIRGADSAAWSWAVSLGVMAGVSETTLELCR